jgi:heterotetrameric sarcosine oxidase gamma subunit
VGDDMTPRSAVQAALSPGRYGATMPSGAGVRLREVRGYSAWVVTHADTAAGPAPTRLPPGPDGVAIGLAPRRWLVIGGTVPPGDDVVTVTGAWTRIGISGRCVADLLSKGCAVDLDPEAFAAGAATQTRFAGLHVILRRPDEADSYEILVARSQAAWLCDWLIEASLEFGCEVA